MLTLSDREKDMLKAIINDDEIAETFVEILLEEINSDDEKLATKGRNLARHLLENSGPDVLMDMCGWTVSALFKKVKERMCEK